MQPVGILMREHRLIERMLVLLEQEQESLARGNPPNLAFLDAALWFLHTYLGTCHQGKEEKILFEDLRAKELSVQHRAIMQGLEGDQKRSRDCVARLIVTRQTMRGPGTHGTKVVQEIIVQLINPYPLHMETENTEFFLPVMEYFTKAEQEAMVTSMEHADRDLFGTTLEEWIATWERSRKRWAPD